ncbi:hypothetical protein AB0A74_32385 [Saccharothrix sp. NPDC042600]|uniref:hypothetical protein n=1 Tax=Saccharothrix TaxID=2071 RepID=UPI0033C6EFD4|nr:hypothetical protein GCM10017745_70000 [Saccharothrix mutabilis subsp. capreolus]
MSEPTNTPDASGGFRPFRSTQSGPCTGPAWDENIYAKASLHRITSSPTVGEAQAQAMTEAVVLLHSLRRLLTWTLIILPLLALALGVTLVVVLDGAACTPSLYNRC